jgi:para-nitrobenzyl esterase
MMSYNSRLTFALIASALALVEVTAQSASAVSPVIQTRSGAVVGDGADVWAFKGIPYAAPPVGELRWRPPAPPTPWDGVRKSTSFGEDCLTVNIWTMANSTQGKSPVMVFVYGGGFINGSGSRLLYDGEALARKSVVLVTFNYRSGVFGFLAHPLLTHESPHKSSGNYGLLDIIAALRWVKDNIADFGGDPARITLFGESSGASAISVL